MPQRPIAVWIVVVMTTCVALYQFPKYNIPVMYSPLYFLGCGTLIYGFYSGARWAFVVSVVTVWIFPFETYIGIKPPLRGSILSVLHFVSLGLLVYEWRFFWRRGVRSGGGQTENDAA